MARPRITVAMPVRDEASRYLKEALESASAWADRMVVLDDCSTDDSPAIARSCGAEVYRTPEPLFRDEWRLRTMLWEHAAAKRPEWIFALDADELLQDGWADEIEDICASPAAAWVAFRLFDLWDTRTTYRDDELWNAHRRWTPQMVRYRPWQQYQFRRTAQHCGRLPETACTPGVGVQASSVMLHLGWLRHEDRARKGRRYAELDPGARYGSAEQYASILDPAPRLSRLAGGMARPERGPRQPVAGPPCPHCAQRSARFQRYRTHRLWTCPGCGLVFQEEAARRSAAAMIPGVYGPGWVAERDAAREETFREHVHFYVTLLSALRPQPGELLEIGSGTGEFAFGARSAGWSVTGIEPSDAARRYALERYGIHLVRGTWPQAGVPRDFHVIVALHVIEHSADPAAFLRAAAEHLRPGGLLVLATPNVDGPVNDIEGRASGIFSERDHLWHFGLQHVWELVDGAGLQVRHLTTRTPWPVFQRLTRGMPASGTPEALARELLSGQTTGRGHEIVCVAEKA